MMCSAPCAAIHPQPFPLVGKAGGWGRTNMWDTR